MFNFKKKILDPLARSVGDQINEALLTTSTVTDRIERLLAAKDAANEKLASVEASEASKASKREFRAWLACVLLMPVFVIASGVLAIPWIVPVAANLLGFAAAAVIPTSYTARTLREIEALRHSLNQKIDKDVRVLALAQPQEAAKSPRFMKARGPTFNSFASVAATRPLSTPESEQAPDALRPFPLFF